MKNIAFWFDAPIDYTGGLNYIKNLLYAISQVNNGSIRPHIFFSSDIPKDLENDFSKLANVIKTDLLKPKSFLWWLHQGFYRVFGSMALVTKLLKRYRIDVVSHVWFLYKGKAPFKLISWIPDFQFLHLPEMFPHLDPSKEAERLRGIIEKSDAVILSSNHAFKDFKQIAAQDTHSRARILHFVSQPQSSTLNTSATKESIEEKYAFKGPFFFLPNQFWAHKNHMVVLQAVKLLKEKGLNVLVLCTGNTKDYRSNNNAYFEGICRFIKENNLGDNIKVLGLISYGDVLYMMRNSIAVINPSRFEGWSSTVEEAKSTGRTLVLSNIEVHQEQSPEKAFYFEPDDQTQLAAILESLWTRKDSVSQTDNIEEHLIKLRERTLEYGAEYLQIVDSVLQQATPLAKPFGNSKREHYVN